MAKTKKQKKAWVDRESIVKLFIELGYSKKVVAKWDDKKLLDKVVNLPQLTDGVKFKNKKAKAFCTKLMAIPEGCLGLKKGGEPQPIEPKQEPIKIKTHQGPAKKKKSKPKKKPQPVYRQLTRPQAVVSVLKATRKNITMEDVATKANDAIIAKGGEGNIKESMWHVKKVVTALSLWGILKVEGGVVKRAS